MKPFIFDSAVTDPVDIVRRDYMENLVDKILQRRGNPKQATEMEYEVSWLDYSQESRT